MSFSLISNIARPKRAKAIAAGILASGVLTAGLIYKNERLRIQPFPEFSPGDFPVVLQEDGFAPGKLRVSRGSTVTFTTLRTEHFWPASDFHPTHTIYPEFDPQRPLEASESWSFMFNKKGIWEYHDHLAPYLTGIIEVTESDELGAF